MQQGSNDRSLVDSKKIISSKLQSFPNFNQDCISFIWRYLGNRKSYWNEWKRILKRKIQRF